jgi:hypothetical protein
MFYPVFFTFEGFKELPKLCYDLVDQARDQEVCVVYTFNMDAWITGGVSAGF